MNIAIIPARGGSKRIPRKNIREFCGRPMIAWSIEAAKATSIFDRIIVSTDDAQIAQVARQWGAETPFMRSEVLSDDNAGTTPVIAHAIEWAKSQGLNITAVCCIYATAPFVQSGDIKHGLQALLSGGWDYVFSATEFSAPIFRSFQQSDNGGVEMFFPENFEARSQDLPIALHDAAQFYWGTPQAWAESRQIFDRQSKSIMIPRWRVQDIDTPDDWLRAELMFKVLNAMSIANE